MSPTRARPSAPTLSIVIPAYLEEENLRLLLPRVRTTCDSLGASYEILVVDTQSPLDATEDACNRNQARWIPRREGNFYGNAVRTGIEESRGQFVLFMDADGSHTPEFIPKMYARRQDADVVIASRYVEGGFTENPRVLIIMSHVLNVIYRLVLGLRCSDVSNSFKLYRGDMLRTLTLRCDNFDIVEEILVKLKRKKSDLSFAEIPFTFKKRMFGQTKRNLWAFVLTYIFTLVRLRLGR